MDKIWYKNSSKSEVIGRCGGQEKEKQMITQNQQKLNVKKKNDHLYSSVLKMWKIACIV